MEGKRFISIRSKLVVSFLVLALIPLIAMGLSGGYNVAKMGEDVSSRVSDQLMAKAKSELANVSFSSAEKVELLTDQYKNDIQMLSQYSGNSALLAARISDPNWLNSTAKTDVDNFYRKIQLSRPEMSNVRLFFKDGYTVSRLRGGNNTLIDTQTGKVDYKGDKIWFRLTMDTAKTAADSINVSAINIARNNNKTEIRYTVPVSVGKDRAGLVIINYTAAAITQSLADTKIGKAGYAFMVDKNYETAEGKPIAGGMYLSHPTREICDEDNPGTVVDIDKLTGDSGFTTFTDGGKEWTAAYRKVQVPGREWYVVSTIPTGEIMSSAQTLGSGIANSVKEIDRNLWILVFASIILVGGGAFMISRQITKPIKQLTEVADKISKGDTDVSVDVESNDEIGTLAAAFDRMVISLKFLMDDDDNDVNKSA